MARNAHLEASTFQKRPAYRYIRVSDKLPTCDEARSQADPIAKVKLFSPTSSWSWFIAGYDPDTHTAWGLTTGHEDETGEIAMEEIVDFRDHRFGLPIERDLYFSPKPISECSPRS